LTETKKKSLSHLPKLNNFYDRSDIMTSIATNCIGHTLQGDLLSRIVLEAGCRKYSNVQTENADDGQRQTRKSTCVSEWAVS